MDYSTKAIKDVTGGGGRRSFEEGAGTRGVGDGTDDNDDAAAAAASGINSNISSSAAAAPDDDELSTAAVAFNFDQQLSLTEDTAATTAGDFSMGTRDNSSNNNVNGRRRNNNNNRGRHRRGPRRGGYSNNTNRFSTTTNLGINSNGLTGQQQQQGGGGEQPFIFGSTTTSSNNFSSSSSSIDELGSNGADIIKEIVANENNRNSNGGGKMDANNEIGGDEADLEGSRSGNSKEGYCNSPDLPADGAAAVGPDDASALFESLASNSTASTAASSVVASEDLSVSTNTDVPAPSSNNEEKDEEEPVKPQPPSPDLTGKDIIICNVQSKPEYNGTRARCMKWHPAKGRYSVKAYQTGHMMLLKPSCVQSLSSVLDPRDNLDEAIRYLKRGRIHAVSFAKNFPYTTQGLFEGRIDPKQFSYNLIGIVYEDAKEKDPNLSSPWSQVYGASSMPSLGYFLSDNAIPPDWFHQENGCGGGLREEVLLELSNTYQENCDQMPVAQLMLARNKLLVVEKLFRRACVQCADKIDCTVFNGNRGSFLRLCPLLRNSQQFTNIVSKATYHIEKHNLFRNMFNQLFTAAKWVRDGVHEPERECWECKKPTKSDTCCCGGCGLAAYCSQECQSKAWKDGHKHKCPTLKSAYEACEESFAIMETLYDEKQQPDDPRFLHHGIELNHENDCQIVSTAHINFQRFQQQGLGVPSMDLYYQNLGKVAQGEWWIWPESETCSLAAYKDHIVDQEDSTYFLLLASTLLFDPIATFEAYNECVRGMQNSSGINIPMPAERFLEIYTHSVDHLNNRPVDRSLRCRKMKCSVLHDLQPTLHK